MIPEFGSTEGLMTAEELLRADIPHKSTELVRGRLIVSEPPSTQHGRVQSKLNFLVGRFVYAETSGALFGQDTGFRIASDPDTVRAPDLAFVRQERISLIAPSGYAAMAPDLVAEILSPGDPPGEALAKVSEWLEAGVEIAWLIDPERRTAQVYRSDGSVAAIPRDGVLEGDNVLPGLTVVLAGLFE